MYYKYSSFLSQFSGDIVKENSCCNNKTAVIVETRCSIWAPLVIKNFITVLDNSWNLRIFGGQTFIDYIVKCLPGIKLEIVNIGIDILDIKNYNKLLCSSNFWNIIPEEHILIFQLDTILLQNIPNNILNYDYIGPVCGNEITPETFIINGGLSIRKKSKMLEVLEIYTNTDYINEDIFYTSSLRKIKNSNLPKFEICNTYFGESIILSSNKLVGIHGTDKFYNQNNILIGNVLSHYTTRLKSNINIKSIKEMAKIFMPIVAYGGMVHTDYMTSMLVLTKTLSDAGIDTCFSVINSESLIPRGRNGAVALFMQSDATHILFIDTDLKFNASAVLKMLKADVEVIGGSYPKKSKDKTKYGLSFAQTGEIYATQVDNIYRASYLPGGFMLIKKSAIKRLQLSKFTQKYKNQLNFYSTTDNKTEYHYDLFPCKIVKDVYLSEDYGFCHLCHLENITVFLYSDITFSHFSNNYPFTGNLEDKIKMEKV